MKTALVHEWLETLTGSEEVALALHELRPGPLHVLYADRAALRGTPFERIEVRTSFVGRCPFVRGRHRLLLPLFPLAVESFDLSGFDLVLSSSHCVAKGVLTREDQLHVCYCHTPVRYAWDLHHEYLRDAGLARGVKGVFARLALHYLRLWDVASAGRPTHYVANSTCVARRIAKLYGREAAVIHPPVDVDAFRPAPARGDYYLAASRLVPYKRIDLLVEAFSRLPDRKLVVVGEGPELPRLKRLAGRNVEFAGWPGRARYADLLARARAYLFAAFEDFGIAPVEAAACGVPVLAYGRGGALDSVVDGETGLLFDRQTPFDVAECVRRFEAREGAFDPARLRRHAERFSRPRFLAAAEEAHRTRPPVLPPGSLRTRF